ncbi:AfsR/SARP family transcriptional regulator [Streptomyces sp. NBC_01565]|uniref:AfsR/SARP family transcriptional regulator n=1 Tax=unclassified Streptomyces TaxID=2593676 RepID=UPI00225C01CF|nr:AfsR/SARP family transcriptional regulator [Streptomyces sp. NBC_01565]MCX4539302.1 winged helix-turn-helix domain-containing protein [Streptomyces sp. NBC_01565]
MHGHRGATFEFRILGPLEARCAGETVAVTAPKERDLLALLLLKAGHIVPAEELIDGLWGATPPTTARTTLQNYVKRLRRILEQPGGGHRELLATRPGGYLLRLEGEFLDLGEFERLVRGAAEAAARGDDATVSARLDAALSHWRGEALAGSRSEYLRQVEMPRLEEARMVAFEQRVDADLRMGRHTTVIAELQGEAARHPLRERLQAQLVLALYRAGRRGDALAASRQAREHLVRELGLEPGPELAALHTRVLADDPALMEPRPAAAPQPSAASGQSGRSASVGHTAPGAATTAPSVLPSQLPPTTMVFTGRAAVMRRLDELMPTAGPQPPGAARVAQITGQGGVGKTALAVHWGHSRRNRFPDGQLYVNLRGHGGGRPLRPLDALSEFLEALGVPARDIPVTEERGAARFRSLCADRRLLVILDDARSEEQVRPLLPGSADCMVIVTSRLSLAGLVARDGAVPVPLPVLEPSEAERMLVNILGPARVSREPEAAAALTAACARLPLAVGISAADLALHPDRTLARQVERLAGGDSLSALELPGDSRSAVRTVFAMSYATLEPDAARMFRLLGLVPGGDITARGAAALAGARLDRARALLDSLTRSHLLEERTVGRYALHDLLRAYTRERAHAEESESERDATLRRLYDWYLANVDKAARVIQPEMVRLRMYADSADLAFDTLDDAADWLDAERANVVAMVQRAAEQGPLEAAWGLADAFRPYLMHSSHTADWLAVGEAALAAAEADGHALGQAATHRILSSAYLVLGRYEESTRHDLAAAELYRGLGAVAAEAAACNSLALAAWYSGRLDDAVAYGSRGLARAKSAGDLVPELILSSNLGAILHEAGMLREAEEHHEHMIDGRAMLQAPTTEGHILRNFAAVLHDRGQPARAAELLARAEAVHRRAGQGPSNLVYTLYWKAVMALQAGDRAAALEHVEEGFSVPGGDIRAVAHLHTARGMLCERTGGHEAALRCFEQARDLARQCSSRKPELDALTGMARCALKLGRPELARSLAEELLEEATANGYRLFRGYALTLLAETACEEKDHPEAELRAREAVAVQKANAHPRGEAEALIALAHALRGAGDTEGARTRVHEAAQLWSGFAPRRVEEILRLADRLDPGAGTTPRPHPAGP